MSGEIGTAFVRIRPKSDGFASEARQQVGGAIGNIGRETGRTIATGLAVGTAAVAALGVQAVRTQMEFNSSMGEVAAVANETAGGMDVLREAALEAGAASVFTATEAANAQGELARAGVSTADILGGALTGSLDLAAAGQMGLADSATIAAQAMKIFKLGGDDVTHIADVLAAGANKSAADVKQLGDALRQGGLVSSQLGVGLEDTVGALALFADNALIGSDAGTSFKTMLQRVVPSSATAAGEMEKLGLSFFDAQGNFVGLEEAAGRMQKAFGSLTQEQRAASMYDIFGSDAIRAANVLYEAGAEGIREYTAAVDDQGAASRMAATALDNLKGDVEAFRGELETSEIRLADLGDRSFRSIVQGGENVVGVFNTWATSPTWDALQARFDRVGIGAGSGLDQVAVSLERVLASISVEDVNRVFDHIEDGAEDAADAVRGAEGVVAGLAISLAGLGGRAVLGPLGGMLPVLNPVVGVLGGLVAGSDEGRAALGRLAGDATATGRTLGTGLLRDVGSVADDLGGKLGVAVENIGTGVLRVADVLGPVLGRAIKDLAPPIGDLTVAGSELVGDALEPAARVVADVLGPALDVAAPAVELLADGVELLADNTDVLIPLLAAVAAVRLTDTVRGWGSALENVGSRFGDARERVFGLTTTIVEEVPRGAFQLSHLGTAAETTSTQVTTMSTSARNAAGNIKGLAGGLVSGLNPAVLGVTAAVALGTIAYQRYAENKRRVTEASDRLRDALDEEADKYRELRDADLRKTLEDKNALDAANELGISMGDLSETTALYGDEIRRLDGLFADTFSATGSIGIFRDMVSELPEPVRELANNVADLVEAGAIDDGQALRFFQALDEMAQSGAKGMAAYRAELESIAREAEHTGTITKSQLGSALEQIANAKTPDQLNAVFNELSGMLGATADEAATATTEIRNLTEALFDLQGSQLSVDQAERDLLDTAQRLNEAFEKNGATLDQTTEAGRRNRDALDANVQAAFDLAAAQAVLDSTGTDSRATLENQAAALGLVAAAAGLTDEEYQALLETYRLTPAQITARVNADTAAAKEAAQDITNRINNLPGVSEDVKARIRALVDEGSYAEAEAELARLERERITRVRLEVSGGGDGALWNAADRRREADGGVLDFFAAGGIRGREQHVAQIAPAGAWRVWAEPETGGEAYIPLAASKRDRSLRIWGETGRRLGVDPEFLEQLRSQMAVRFADGGITAPALPAAVAPRRSGGGDEIAARLDRLTAAITRARPIHVHEASSARQTADQVVLAETRVSRMLEVT